MFMPDMLTCKMRYAPGALENNVGNLTASRSWRSSIYDIDPLLGSTSDAGYNELVAFYSRWRVLSISVHMTAVNRESFPLTLYAGFSNNLFAGNAYNFGYQEGPRSMSTALSVAGGQDQKSINLRATAISVVGDALAITDVTYSGTAAGNPTSMWYFNIGVNSGTGTVLVNGIYLAGYIELEVEFFDRATLAA